MSDPIPDGYEYHVAQLGEHPGLTCRFLKAGDFDIADLPPETPDFSNASTFMPLAVAVCPYGPMVFTAAARPSFDDGTVSQWLDYICDAEGYEHSSPTAIEIGALAAVTCDALQKIEDGSLMTMRFVLLEDGGRLFQMSAMAPQVLWTSAEQRLAPMLSSFELQEVRGSVVALFPGEARMAADDTLPSAESGPEPQPASTSAEPNLLLTDEEFAALARADDASSFDPEESTNANLRDRGVGLVPNVVEIDETNRAVVLACGAVQGFIRLPFGWHVIDDGSRTLIFDTGRGVQISLDVRPANGLDRAGLAQTLVQPYLENEPGLQHLEMDSAGIATAAVRGADIDGELLDQYFMVRDVGFAAHYLVARVTATEAEATRAMNLAGDIVARFRTAP